MKKILILSVFFMFFSCDEDITVRELIAELEKSDYEDIMIVEEEPAGKTDPDIVELVKANLHKLKNGMSTDEVFNVLYLDTKFNGIVTSEGGKSDFTFYYELSDDHELRLTFDYSKSRFGELTKYNLDNT